MRNSPVGDLWDQVEQDTWIHFAAFGGDSDGLQGSRGGCVSAGLAPRVLLCHLLTDPAHVPLLLHTALVSHLEFFPPSGQGSHGGQCF